MRKVWRKRIFRFFQKGGWRRTRELEVLAKELLRWQTIIFWKKGEQKAEGS